MTLPTPRSRRRHRCTSAAAALLILVAAACSGTDDAGGDPVPTLLTTPRSSTSTSSTSSPSTTIANEQTTAPATQPATSAESVTTTTAASGDVGAPSGPGAPPLETSASTAAPASSGAIAEGATSSAGATSTSADIEPPPPSLASTVPVPTAAQPPDTTGGRDVDFLLGPRSIAGLQFGASQTTVLNRMRQLLGDPVRVDTLPDCPGGPGTALQWFNASVIITDRGLAYYIVGLNLEDYEDHPVPGWHTATMPELVGANRAQLDAAYPQQIGYDPPQNLFTPFRITAGTDAGIMGRLEGDLMNSISAGAASC